MLQLFSYIFSVTVIPDILLTVQVVSCLSITLVSPAKTAAPIKMPFGLRTWVGLGKHVLYDGPDPPWEGAILRGKGAPHCKV